jgi:hypothetical protein
VKKSIVLSAGSVVVASACMGLFGTGVATADDYAGQKYSDAASAASSSGLTSVVAARVGDKLATDDCLVTRSQVPPFTSADDGSHRSGQVQFYLNCAGAYATATNPGASMASPEGREAKAAADQAAAEEEAPLEEVSTPDQ